MGHDLNVFAPVELKGYQCDEDEPHVKRCYTLRKYRNKPGFFFDPRPFLMQDCDVFVVQNLEILPMQELLKVYPFVRERAKTVFVVHEGKPSKDPIFYEFDWDAIVCFDERYQKFLKEIYSKDNQAVIIPISVSIPPI